MWYWCGVLETECVKCFEGYEVGPHRQQQLASFQDRISMMSPTRMFFCYFLLYTVFGPVSRRQPLVRSLSRRRHGAQLLRSRCPRGHHRFPGKRQEPGLLDDPLPAQRNPVPHPHPRVRVQRRSWTESDSMRALARGGHRGATPAREQGEGLVSNDFEEPLPIGALDGYLDKFEAFFHCRPLSHGDPRGAA